LAILQGTSTDQLALSTNTAHVVDAIQTKIRNSDLTVPLEEDPLFDASRHLSPPFLASFTRLNQISPWSSYIFNKLYPQHATPKMKETAGFVEETLKLPPDTNSAQYRAMSEMVKRSRWLLSHFVMPELLAQAGIDIEREFVVPMKLFELEQNFELYDPSIDNRIRGMTIPRHIREMRGWLDFAAKARASHSIVSALIPMYQWIVTTNAYQA